MRYFFDIHDGKRFMRDADGSELSNIEHAKKEARATLPEIARTAIPRGDDHQAFTVLVRDDSGAVVYTATMTFSGLSLEHGTDSPSGS